MALAGARESQNHIRPFVPHRDLDDLATLIEVAFSRELELTGSTIVRDLRQMARWSPFITRSANLIAPFLGFVWVEGGRVVGNVSLTRDALRQTWTMSNVAVLPEYRGRGIAGELVDIAIKYVIQAQGRSIKLQVRQDNRVAREMYLRRGFAKKMSWHELQLTLPNVPETTLPLTLHRVGLSGRRDVKRLYRETVKSQLGAPFSCGVRIAGMLDGTRLVERCVREHHRIVAYGVVRCRVGGAACQAEIRALPSRWGEYESALLAKLFASVKGGRFGPIQILIPGLHVAARNAALALGMRPLRVLEEMELTLKLTEG